MDQIKAIKGTHDILPDEIYKWQYVEATIRRVCANFNYNEIRIPVFENTELFSRGVGDTTDVVQKEMYSFNDKGGRNLTLRPEGTASVVRSLLENSLYAGPLPVKLYYMISCYRQENPQAGRYREFNQFGVEVFGSFGPSVDAEIISLAVTFFESLGLKDIILNINSIGCPICRNEYNNKLRAFLFNKSIASTLFKIALKNDYEAQAENIKELCPTCRGRYSKNPMRILDCKDEGCKKFAQNAPSLLDHICTECEEHFSGLKNYLNGMGINYSINPKIVRGLDYYTKTVFEFTSDSLGAQSTVCGGGRYDKLVEHLGGKPLPGIGFGMGLERLLMCLDAQNINIPSPTPIAIFITTIGAEAEQYANNLVYKLRMEGIGADKDTLNRGLKAQMKYADKTGAKYTVTLGDNEIKSGKCSLKNMATGEMREIILENIIKELQEDK